nr:TOBE domain-containing protein [uncultured Holophaga sp.]
MNRLQGTITGLSGAGSVVLVDVAVRGHAMAAVVIGEPGKAPYLGADRTVELLFNESEVSLGRIREGAISLGNQLPCRVQSVEAGAVLSQVHLDFEGATLTSLITTRAALALGLGPGMEVTAFIKNTEVMLREAGNHAD